MYFGHNDALLTGSVTITDVIETAPVDTSFEGTTAARRTFGLFTGAAVALIVAFVGTGGLTYKDHVRDRLDPAKRYEATKSPSQAASPSSFLSVAEQLALVKKTLQPSMSELASIFQVSRQSIYDWQKGSQPSEENLRRLGYVANVASAIGAVDLPRSGSLLKVTVVDGRTLLEIAREGEPFEWAVKVLAQRQKTFEEERARITRLFKNKSKNVDAESLNDIGVPHLAS